MIKICANVSHANLKIKFVFARQRCVKETMQLKPFNYLKIKRIVIIVKASVMEQTQIQLILGKRRYLWGGNYNCNAWFLSIITETNW